MARYAYNAPDELDITIYRGVDWRMLIAWEPGGAPGDLTGYTVTLEFMESAQSAAALLTVEAEITDAAHGLGLASLTATQIAALIPPSLHWRMKFTPAEDPAFYRYTGTASLVHP